MTTQYGPCAKVRVLCTLVHPTNGQRYIGENHVRKPQQTCPRGDMPSGMGYDLCIDVCDQVGHAEIVALSMAGKDAAGCTAYIKGRDYICTNCQAALFKAGVKSWVLGAPPTAQAVTQQAAKAEPVAKVVETDMDISVIDAILPIGTKLYLAPATSTVSAPEALDTKLLNGLDQWREAEAKRLFVMSSINIYMDKPVREQLAEVVEKALRTANKGEAE